MGKSTKDNRDIYYRLAKEEGWRARSAFKLLQIDEQYKIFEGVENVVDLCAAPGSWSQVLVKKIKSKNKKIIAVDLQHMAKIPEVIQIVGDITKSKTAEEIIEKLEGTLAQLVVCDGAPDGLHEMDEFVHIQLLVAALNITTHILGENGVFVAKIFKCNNYDLIKTKFAIFFRSIQCIKPHSSRSASIVCKGFKLPNGYKPTLINALNFEDHKGGIILLTDALQNSVNKKLLPFILYGDLDGV